MATFPPTGEEKGEGVGVGCAFGVNRAKRTGERAVGASPLINSFRSPCLQGLKAIAGHGAAALPHNKIKRATALPACRGLTGGEDWGEFEGGGWKGLPPSKAPWDCPKNGGNLATPERT